jgi:putative ABC transport system substrate-binding protein
VIARREFLVGLASAVTAVPVIAQTRVPRVGMVSGGSPSLNALLQGLRDLGWVPGQTVLVEHRPTEGHAERYGPAVESLLKMGVDVMVVTSPHGLGAARSRARKVPIVAIDLESDPLASGVVASFSRPGGNVTGFFLDQPEMSGKLVELLKEVLPGINRAAVLWDGAIARAQFDAMRSAARAAGIAIHSASVQKAAELGVAFDHAVRDGARAVIVLSAPLMRVNQALVDELALRRRLPALTLFALTPDGDGFISYGPDLNDMIRRSALYVDRILKGASVSDLPVVRPSRFYLAINLRTAKALGLSIPQSVLLRADRVLGE